MHCRNRGPAAVAFSRSALPAEHGIVRGTRQLRRRRVDRHHPTRARKAFVLDEVNFTWATPHDVPGLAALTGTSGFSRLTALSCKSAGNCTVTGQFSDTLRGTRAFVASEVNGTWGNAIEVPGITALSGGGTATASAVSCASAGNCAAGGQYFDSTPAEHAFVVTEANGT